MSIDVLAYNALNADIKASRTCSANLTTTISDLNSNCTTYSNIINSNAPIITLSNRMIRPEIWQAIPTGESWTAGFKVCDTSEYFRCGSTCSWTVPAGVTCARFQIWGAGASSGAAGCCGGAPFGGSGAYASVVMPVTAGDTYILCGGCAFCCYGTWNAQSNQNGCQSFVTGTGLTNFCADGGIGNLCTQSTDRNVYYRQGTCATSPMPDPGYTGYLGYCLCGSGSSWCHDGYSTPYNYNGCLTCGAGFMSNPHLMYQSEHSSALAYGSASSGTVYGIRGSYPEICLNLHCACGYVKNVPIYGFESSSQCCFCRNGGTSCGGNYCSASATFGAVIPSLLIPGSGGYAMQVAGGCLSICGDAGRMGMVCVSYK
jgi:hypothetical protein